MVVFQLLLQTYKQYSQLAKFHNLLICQFRMLMDVRRQLAIDVVLLCKYQL